MTYRISADPDSRNKVWRLFKEPCRSNNVNVELQSVTQTPINTQKKQEDLGTLPFQLNVLLIASQYKNKQTGGSVGRNTAVSVVCSSDCSAIQRQTNRWKC